MNASAERTWRPRSAFAWVENSPESRKRLDEAALGVMQDLDRSFAALLLESDSAGIVALFEDIRDAYFTYRWSLGDGDSSSRSPAATKDLIAALTELDAKVPELERLAREQLSSLEQPL